jgi:tetratricopeptide (TPR) repeat protein
MVIALALLCVGNAAAQKKDELVFITALELQILQLYGQGRYADAIALARKVLAMREKAFGPDHPNVARNLHNLAVLYANQGRYAEGLTFSRRAVAILGKRIGRETFTQAGANSEQRSNRVGFVGNITLAHVVMGS